ncbi:hypothetical protein PMI22_05185 [Pseudomonas sp. GM21]|uniref:hypothetical protein n=1 Tax=Pseudomonas sp. GM21 TaxID=1144325 RepID=UPI00027229A4|nr:hypothetical protein [Pseudomonas sp. GM21]EJM12875.1 hypothetical protein PMI22_05185 [Pseudomonas sp. GM21]
MSTLKTRYAQALCSVGGRLYRLVELFQPHVLLEDVQDGHRLSFTQDEAFKMLVQQDLIIVSPPVSQHCVQTLAEMVNPPKPTARQPTMSPNHAAAEDALRRGTEQRHCRCTTRQQGIHERSARLVDRQTAYVRLIILDEFSRYQPPDAVTRAQTLARLKVDAQALKLCPESGGNGRAMLQLPPVGDHPPSKDRWPSERRNRVAATAPAGGHPKTPAWTFITLLGMTPWLPKGARPYPAEDLSRPVRGVAVERAGSRRGTAERGRNSALDAEARDVE